MFDITRRKLVGAALLGTGAVLGGLGLSARADTLTTKGRIMLDAYPTPPRGLVEAATFPLIEAIHGRRSRRFAKGATIPDGPLAFTSRQAPEPLDPLEQMLLLATVSGNTGWAELFAHHPGYAAKLPNYTTAAGGRSFPVLGGLQHLGVLLHRRQRRLLPADARHDARRRRTAEPTSANGSRRTGRASSSSRTAG